MTTRENKLADAIATLLDGETFGVATASATRAYRYQETLENLATTAAGTLSIVVVPLSNPDNEPADRKSDRDTILISIIVAGSVASMGNDDVDPWSAVAEAVQDKLRGPDAQTLTEDGATFLRRSSPTRPAPSDARWLEMLVFASQIVCEYSTGVSRR